MLRLPKLPLSMTAVAVVTPSSGAKSTDALLFWVVGADTCPSLVVARGSRGPLPREPVRSPLCGVLAGSGATGLRSKLSGGDCPGATTEDRRHLSEGGGFAGSRAAGAVRERGPSGRTVPSSCLPAQTEPLDERAVPVDVGLRQVVQQAAAPPDQQEQAPPAVVVVLVLLEVLGEVADPAGQHRDLDLRRAGVVLDRRVLGHDLLLDSALERHGRPPGQVACGPRSGSRGQRAHTSGTRRHHSG